ncbi:phosphatidate cytidylyltransferase [Candidatus Cyrtobacter comes]|uniref:phosphatidate cytidylyltransferase n=1 Tax=Candidatus Cyrtobacter comes TaxID=675776 RepID=UPI002ACDAD83|nr:phosphatidate cytidylyltransferase [Candidatus Cyrtobacter comes]
MKRLISSVLLIPVVIWLAYLGSIPYKIFVFCMLFISLLEYRSIILKNNILVRRSYVMWLLLGLAIAVASFISLIYLRNVECCIEPNTGFFISLFFFVTVWMTDISAYVVGKLVGGPKIFPKISPKKTYSGVIAGILVPLLIYLIFEHDIFSYTDYIMTLSISIAVVFGDFLESAFKRRFGVKDSGAIIPGHGGVLDRIDGLIFASITFAVVTYFSL